MLVQGEVFETCDRLIARIDELIERQVNTILHDPKFMEMEARWRGLAFLISMALRSQEVKIRCLPVSRAEIERDLVRAGEFDQSHLFDLVYSREFGMPGGEPFGLIVADFMMSPDDVGSQIDVVGMLAGLSNVAAAAFCPLIAGASAEAAGIDDFSDLNRVLDLQNLEGSAARLRWSSLRAQEDSRFIGLVAPRVLMRPVYSAHDRRRIDSFPFRERIAADGSTLLWANGAFAFAAVVIRTFVETGWFADLRGSTQGEIDGGLLASDELAPLDLGLESDGLSAQPPVEVRLTSRQAEQLADLGIVPISTTYLSSGVIFNSNQSLHAPPRYSSEYARQNARLAAMLQYVLCASRFSHYLKVMMRDEIGQLADPRIIQERLSRWLSEYTLGNDDASIDLRTRFPLRSAGIEVGDIPGKPGCYACTVRLQPHFQLDDVSTSFHLVAENVALQNNPRQAEVFA
ncbi:type VI secretion system contractile sheath large subunit [Fulvimarina sp. MAC8]|uniref:type VI secretion system contractile sheath large subunit n=1 Tax=Fulvimarina sp. MAC8 TaxID=3162874 RepID=UPI0032EEE8CC